MAFLLRVGGLECQGEVGRIGGVNGVEVADRVLQIGCCKDDVVRRDKKSPIKSAFGLGLGVEGKVEKVDKGDTPSALVVLLLLQYAE